MGITETDITPEDMAYYQKLGEFWDEHDTSD